jgi:hypothetical protein
VQNPRSGFGRPATRRTRRLKGQGSVLNSRQIIFGWLSPKRIDQNGDESDRDYHLHFARRVNDSVYKYERKIDAELENKVLSLVLGLYGYQRSDCQRYSIVPGGQGTPDSQSIAVLSSIQVTDRKDKKFFETIDGWKGMYNLEKGEVFQVLDTGKVSVRHQTQRQPSLKFDRMVKRRKRSGAGKEIANQMRSKLRAPSMSPSITSGW